MSLISSLSIAQQALAVNQAAITVCANNIANADNENYSKLRVNLSGVVNYTKLSGEANQQANTLGGVQISDIERYSNEYLESYYRSENSQYSYLSEYTTAAGQIADMMNELQDTGLSEALSNFYDAADSLADDPTDVTLRQNYLSCAETVCTVFNSINTSLSGLQESLVGDTDYINSCDSSQIGTEIDTVNSLLDQIAEVNKSIKKTNATDTSSTSLLDKRDELLTELSSYIPINTEIAANGTVEVSLGTYDLVAGATVTGYFDVTTGTAAEPAVINIVDENGTRRYSDINDKIDSGSVGAILDICGTDSTKLTISGVIGSLDKLASAFATTLNSIQAGSITQSGTTTYAMCLTSNYQTLTLSSQPLFDTSDGGASFTAANISINSTLENNLNLIAVGRSSTGVNSSDVGNNSNMTMVSNSRNAINPTLGSETFEGYLSTTVSGIGTDVAELESDLKTESSVLKEISSKLSSETGVSLDEELGDLIKYQQAYQAAARVFSTCSDLLSELINLGR